MRPGDLRFRLIVLLALAAVLSVTGNKLHAGWLVALSFTVFAVAVFLILRVRRAGRVLDRKAKTDETRTGPDE